MNDSKVHHCPHQEMVAQGIDEPPARRCRCREYKPYVVADKMVKNGEARWVVVKRERGTQEVTCELCGGDKEVKNCASCAGKGVVTVGVVWDSYGPDIVLVSRAAIDKKEKKYRPALAMKTPRVATVEEEHIERAYAGSLTKDAPRKWTGKGEEARARIEEYGRMIEDARNFVGPNKIPIIKMEPKDNAKKVEGRSFDYGRTI
jgi:hypothetical protein